MEYFIISLAENMQLMKEILMQKDVYIFLKIKKKKKFSGKRNENQLWPKNGAFWHWKIKNC